MAQKDSRKLEKTRTPGIFRRHGYRCNAAGRCQCPYVVRWKDRGKTHKQLFATYDLAREFKGGLDSGARKRQPLSSLLVAEYFPRWLGGYRGRTTRGLEESTRNEYKKSFRLHIEALPIAGIRMRDLTARDVR